MVKERPTFPQLYMSFAILLAQRSTCKRLSVGCIITTFDNTKVVAIGYNGNAAGLHNGCDSEKEGACGCLHAEENAIIKLDSPRELPKVVYCTNLPCPMCAKRIINAGGIKQVYYLKDYRIRTALETFDQVRIPCQQLFLEVPEEEPELPANGGTLT